MVRLIADRAYDGDGFRRHLAARGIELVCPHRKNGSRPATQDGRRLRRYRHRWRIERTIAWLGHFRRLVVRYERQPSVLLAFLYFACALIVLRRYETGSSPREPWDVERGLSFDPTACQS
jgi:transposase